MVIATLADQIMRGADAVADTLRVPFSDSVIRLGVTGLSHAGKTVFITTLVANLMNRGRMPQLVAANTGAIRSAYLQPQPNDTLPRFDYETYLGQLTSANLSWPDGTRQISELRLSLRMQPKGLLSVLTGPRTLHIDIVDYPGEWLLDLGLLDQSYEAWSSAAITRARARTIGDEFLASLKNSDANAPFDEVTAKTLSKTFSTYLHAAHEAGFSDCTPGRFLLPGDLEGSPVLTFAPLLVASGKRGTLGHEFARRFESYKRNVVKPFFRDHFSKIDRQVVLVDVLGAIHAGPPAVEDLRNVMTAILGAFRPGRNVFLRHIFKGRRIEKILFAATKADHLHHTQHGQLTAITEALLRDAKDRADFSGATTAAMSIAALRTTVEETVNHRDGPLNVVRGKLLDSGKQAAFYPGKLPSDPMHLLGPARAGAADWLDDDYAVMRFAPAALDLKPGDGPPHIRLDKAAEFLVGDRL